MKISKMNNNQAADALVRIAGPMGRICDDEELVSMLDSFSKMKNVGLIAAIGRMLPQFVAYALKKHREDLYEIIGSLDGKTQAEVAKMNFVETVKLVKDSYDDILKDFFISSAVVNGKTATASSD